MGAIAGICALEPEEEPTAALRVRPRRLWADGVWMGIPNKSNSTSGEAAADTSGAEGDEGVDIKDNTGKLKSLYCHTVLPKMLDERTSCRSNEASAPKTYVAACGFFIFKTCPTANTNTAPMALAV